MSNFLSRNEPAVGSADLSTQWVTVPAGMYLLAHCVALVWPSPFWGVDGLAYSASWLVLPFVIVSLAILIPSIRLTLSGFLSKEVGALLGVVRARMGVRWILLCVAFLLASTFLVSATQLHGDGQLHVRE